MARSGWSTSNFLRVASGIITAAPCTMVAWCKSSDVTTNQHICGLHNSASTSGLNTLQLGLSSSALYAFAANASTSAQSTGAASVTTNTWFHAGAVFASITSRTAYTNGTAATANSTSITPTGINRFGIGIGDGSTPTAAFTGDIAEVCIWNVALSARDMAALATGIHPFLIRPSSIIGYWPLIGINSPENNLMSNSTTAAIQGSLSQSAHPRVFDPSRRLIRA